jgi:flagellar biosynthesis GTPase FlhF
MLLSGIDAPSFTNKAHNKLPLKFFGTGPVVPDDIEAATAERLMAGLFQF